MIRLSEIAKNIYEADIPDDKMIKYKDDEGESKEMKASSAKKMEKEHPAKIAYDKIADKGDDDSEKDSGGKLGGGDFDRDSNKAGDDDADDMKSQAAQDDKDAEDDLDSQIAQAQKDADDANQMAQQFGSMTQGGDSRYDSAATAANKKLSDLKKQKSQDSGSDDAPSEDEFRFASDHKYPSWWEDEDPVDWSDEDFDAAVDELEKLKKSSDAEKAKLKRMDPEDKKRYMARKNDRRQSLQDKISDAEDAKAGEEKFDPKSDGPHQGGSHFDRNDMEVESSSELDDFVDKYEEKLNDEQRKKLEDVRKKLKAAEEEYKDDPDSFRDEITQYWGEIEDIANSTRFETITYNGKKYREIKESKKPNSRFLKENYDRIFRSRK